MPDFRAATVLAERHVANPVQAIFDAPVLAIERKQLGRRRAIRRQAGDRVTDFAGDQSVFLYGAFDATNLRDPWPVQLPRQTRTGLQATRRDATMPFVFGAMVC